MVCKELWEKVHRENVFSHSFMLGRKQHKESVPSNFKMLFSLSWHVVFLTPTKDSIMVTVLTAETEFNVEIRSLLSFKMIYVDKDFKELVHHIFFFFGSFNTH